MWRYFDLFFLHFISFFNSFFAPFLRVLYALFVKQVFELIVFHSSLVRSFFSLIFVLLELDLWISIRIFFFRWIFSVLKKKYKETHLFFTQRAIHYRNRLFSSCCCFCNFSFIVLLMTFAFFFISSLHSSGYSFSMFDGLLHQVSMFWNLSHQCLSHVLFYYSYYYYYFDSIKGTPFKRQLSSSHVYSHFGFVQFFHFESIPNKKVIYSNSSAWIELLQICLIFNNVLTIFIGIGFFLQLLFFLSFLILVHFSIYQNESFSEINLNKFRLFFSYINNNHSIRILVFHSLFLLFIFSFYTVDAGLKLTRRMAFFCRFWNWKIEQEYGSVCYYVPQCIELIYYPKKSIE